MPPAKKSSARSRRSQTFKQPAALKRLNKSIDTAEQALAELRQHAGRDVSKGARDLYKNLGKFVTTARRDSGKFAKALERDFAQAQKKLAQAATSGSSRSSSTRSRGSSSRSRASSTGSRASSSRSRSSSSRSRSAAGRSGRSRTTRTSSRRKTS